MAANGLSLNPDKTRIRKANEGFDFLGYRFQGTTTRLPRTAITERIKERIWSTTRRSRTSPDYMLREINQILRGWYEYFQLITDPPTLPGAGPVNVGPLTAAPAKPRLPEGTKAP